MTRSGAEPATTGPRRADDLCRCAGEILDKAQAQLEALTDTISHK